jgi:hypothetical protein
MYLVKPGQLSEQVASFRKPCWVVTTLPIALARAPLEGVLHPGQRLRILSLIAVVKGRVPGRRKKFSAGQGKGCVSHGGVGCVNTWIDDKYTGN